MQESSEVVRFKGRRGQSCSEGWEGEEGCDGEHWHQQLRKFVHADMFVCTGVFRAPRVMFGRSERTLSSRLPPRTEDHSVPVVIPWCDLTMYCAFLCARRSVLICHHVLAATNWFCWHCTVVLQQQYD